MNIALVCDSKLDASSVDDIQTTKQIFADKILKNKRLFLSLFSFVCLSGQQQEAKIFPIIIPFVLLASVEIDSIRISIVSLMNWFYYFHFWFSWSYYYSIIYCTQFRFARFI